MQLGNFLNWLKICVLIALAFMVTGCATPVHNSADTELTDDQLKTSAWTQAPVREEPADQVAATSANLSPTTTLWQHYRLPGKKATQYTYDRVDGRDAMVVSAASSASLLRQKIHIPAVELDRVTFSWKVAALITEADLALRDTGDSPVRIVLAFEGDRAKFSAKNAMLSELSHTLTGEPMPYATLMYVWCNTRAPGTVIINPRTDRIRKIVVESGAKNLNHWLDYERNIRADFEKAYGEPPGALVGVAIMTDTDNTRSTARAWYGKVKLARH
jgi:hypothetical protein